MASGRLGTPRDLAATTETSLYTCAATNFAVVSVSICNRNATAVTVRLAVTASGGTAATTDFLEYGATIPANSVLERTGIAMTSGNQMTAWASTTGVTAIAYGIES